MNASTTEALFVTNETYLRQGGGGVQWCTREYLATLKEAGFNCHFVPYTPARDLMSRLKRKFSGIPFCGLHNQNLTQEIGHQATRESARYIFFNNTDASPLVTKVKAASPTSRLVFLSHGVEITDVVNNLRLSPETAPSVQRNSRWLGELLKFEIRIRNDLDATICISEEDVAFERWLGTRQILFQPRQIPRTPLKPNPIKGRVGTVGTLDHGPNLHGLKVLAAAVGEGTTIHVVGGPESIGQQLAREFKSIKYLGRLADDQLQNEVATWCAFVNPIFCHARGASTKVATALGWGLPLLTTRPGARGYRWDEGALPLAETPEALAELCETVACDHEQQSWRERAQTIVALAPTMQESGEQLRTFLNSLPAQA